MHGILTAAQVGLIRNEAGFCWMAAFQHVSRWCDHSHSPRLASPTASDAARWRDVVTTAIYLYARYDGGLELEDQHAGAQAV